MLDNRDSFTFNLVQAFQRLGTAVLMRRAEGESLQSLLALDPAGIVLGPGPGRPENARLCHEIIEASLALPILGVCLGHQAIAQHFGARIERSQFLQHGRTSLVQHDGRGLFQGLAAPSAFTRYNSLTVDEASLPACLEVSARSHEGELMALRHRTRALFGVQFHPESVLSVDGLALLANFVAWTASGPSA